MYTVLITAIVIFLNFISYCVAGRPAVSDVFLAAPYNPCSFFSS